jgi:hypothetical protein
LAESRRNRWGGDSRRVGLSDIYHSLDRNSICNWLCWNNGSTGLQLDCSCFGSLDRRAIVRHARITRLAVRRGLPSQSWTALHGTLRSWGPLYLVCFPGASGSRPTLCQSGACFGGHFLRVGVAGIVAGGMAQARSKATPLASLGNDTIMGGDKFPTRVNALLPQHGYLGAGWGNPKAGESRREQILSGLFLKADFRCARALVPLSLCRRTAAAGYERWSGVVVWISASSTRRRDAAPSAPGRAPR